MLSTLLVPSVLHFPGAVPELLSRQVGLSQVAPPVVGRQQGHGCWLQVVASCEPLSFRSGKGDEWQLGTRFGPGVRSLSRFFLPWRPLSFSPLMTF